MCPRRGPDSAERSPCPEPNELVPLSRRVLTSNFPYTSRPDDLRKLFTELGERAIFRILMTRTGTLRGQDVIQCATIQAAEEAIRRFDDYK
jgi:RNA recognition motif-containing protein